MGEVALSSAPVVVCGQVGKGRYVANGAALGILAPNCRPVKPISGEKQLLINSVYYLAGRAPEIKAGNDIGKGKILDLVKANLLKNSSVENIDGVTRKPV